MIARKAAVTVAVLGMACTAGCSASAKAHAPREVRAAGSVSVTDSTGTYPDADVGDGLPAWGSDGYKPGAGCHTLSGYGDIAPGAEVVIGDDAGRTLAITHLVAGVYDADGGCAFHFSAMVPAGKRFYGVTVSHRGTVKEPEASLGSIALTLGS